MGVGDGAMVAVAVGVAVGAGVTLAVGIGSSGLAGAHAPSRLVKQKINAIIIRIGFIFIMF